MEANEAHYVSPDGTLTFIVLRYPDDVVLGFAGMPWHVHGDMLAELSGYSIDDAVRRSGGFAARAPCHRDSEHQRGRSGRLHQG